MPSAPKWVFDIIERLFTSKLPLMEVVDIAFLSPEVKKIRFKTDFSGLTFKTGDYMDFRVSDTDVRRYTISYVDIENGMLEFIVHLHGKAIGSQYMGNLKIGDKININQPRGHKCYDESAGKYVIFGDETSLAIACSLFTVLKQNQHSFQFYFELDEANKNVPRLLGLENCTVFSKNKLFRNEEWIKDLPLFKTEEWKTANFVLTGNVKSVQIFKKVLKNSGVTGKIFSQGYWLEGKRGL